MSQFNSLDPNGEIIDVDASNHESPGVSFAGNTCIVIFFPRVARSFNSPQLFGSASLGYSAVFVHLQTKLVLFLIFALTVVPFAAFWLIGRLWLASFTANDLDKSAG